MSNDVKQGHGLLIGILIGLALAVVIGAVGGRSMWLAIGGAERDAARARATAEQKKMFAERREQNADDLEKQGQTEEAAEEAAAEREKAKDLRSHIPLNIDKAIELQQQQIEKLKAGCAVLQSLGNTGNPIFSSENTKSNVYLEKGVQHTVSFATQWKKLGKGRSLVTEKHPTFLLNLVFQTYQRSSVNKQHTACSRVFHRYHFFIFFPV